MTIVRADKLLVRTPLSGTSDNSSQGWLEINMATDHSPPTNPTTPSSDQTDVSPLSCAISRPDPLQRSDECGLTKGTTYVDLKLGMDSILREEKILQAEIFDIKQRFRNLLKSSGANNASYKLSPSIIASQHLPVVRHADMSTPRTPQRQHGQNNMCRMYAELLIDQLLAQATSPTDSSDLLSSSPDAESSPDDAHTKQQSHHCCDSQDYYPSPSKSKSVAGVSTAHGINDQFQWTQQRSTGMPCHNIHADIKNTSDEMTSSSNSMPWYASSDAYPGSSETSSDGRTVPDLERELVSRMIYYSDFTIDRQKKLDQASAIRAAVNKENVSPHLKISQRCVEGAEASVLGPMSLNKVLKPSARMRKLKTHSKKKTRKRLCQSSSDDNDCDSCKSSVVGSPLKSERSSKMTSSTSSKERTSSLQEKISSSGRSRCSTHPLASSTFISDPSHNPTPSSQDNSSVYTWSIEDSSECENLHWSYLQSKSRCHQYHSSCLRSQQQHHSSTPSWSSRSQRSNGVRPATLIGADSPPQEQTIKASSSLHLTDMVSRIDAASQSTNVSGISPFRSSSLPRTSTQICLFPVSKADTLVHHSPSMPELWHPLQQDHSVTVITAGFHQSETASGEESSPLLERLELPGKSSTSDSGASSRAICAIDCHGAGITSPLQQKAFANTESQLLIMDSILTDSPQSYDSSGVHPPVNSDASPISSNAGKSAASSGSSGSNHHGLVMQPYRSHTFMPQQDAVFKLPKSPAWTVKQSLLGSRDAVSHAVGTKNLRTKTMSTLNSGHGGHMQERQKLFAVSQKENGLHQPRIIDKKSLVRKFKKFSTNFYKREKIKTLANL